VDALAAYSHALVALAGFAVIVLLLSPVSALAKQKAGLAPGGTPAEDYANPAYRLNRAYLNGCETLPIFLTVTLLAILAGAAPFWVNMLASLVLVTRILMVIVHIRGIGRAQAGARTIFYVTGWALMLGLAILALVALF